MKTIKKEIKKNNGVFYVVISLLGILAVGGFALAAYGVVKNINVQGDYINYEAAQPGIVDNGDQNLGSVTGPDYTWDYQNFNGLTTYVKTGGFADATTTLACVKNPFNATSTVDLAQFIITGAPTSTVAINVGTSTTATGHSTSTVGSAISIIPSVAITADTVGQATNNQNNAQASVFAGGTVAKMAVGAKEYVCFVGGDGNGTSKGFTDNGNTFAGNYVLRFIK